MAPTDKNSSFRGHWIFLVLIFIVTNKKSFPWTRYNWHDNRSIKESFVEFFFPSFRWSVIKIIKEPIDLKNKLLEMLIAPSIRLSKLIPSCGVQVGKISKEPLSVRLLPMACSLRNGNRGRFLNCDNVRDTGLSNKWFRFRFSSLENCAQHGLPSWERL